MWLPRQVVYPAASCYLNPDATRGGTRLVYLSYARGNIVVPRDSAEIGVFIIVLCTGRKTINAKFDFPPL